MNRDEVQGTLARLASWPGVQGCAVADAASGMVCFHAGDLPDMEGTAEAAMELWRVHRRLPARYLDLGVLQSAAFSFAGGLVALFPCTASLVLVCVTRRQAIEWGRWAEEVRHLKGHLA